MATKKLMIELGAKVGSQFKGALSSARKSVFSLNMRASTLNKTIRLYGKVAWKSATSTKNLKKAVKSLRRSYRKARLSARRFSRTLKRLNKHVAGFNRVAGRARSAANDMARIGMFGLTAIATGLALATRESLKFEKATAEVSTIVDTSKVDMKEMTEDIKNLAIELGKDPTRLAQGLYETLSASVGAAKAIAFLREAGKAAVAGITDTKTAADLLTSVLNAYKLELEDTGRVSDIIFKTIEKGKTKFPQLAESMGAVLPIASQLNFSLEEVFASIATITRGGINTARAVTQIRSAFTQMLAPSKEAQKLYEKLRIDMSLTAVRARGFAKTLELIKTATDGDAAAIAKLFPNVRGMAGVLALTGKQAKGFKRDIDALTNSTGASDVAFEKIADTTGFKFAKMLSALTVVSIEVGDEVTKVILEIVEELGGLDKVISDFRKSASEDIKAFGETAKKFFGDGGALKWINRAKSAFFGFGVIVQGVASASQLLYAAQAKLGQQNAKVLAAVASTPEEAAGHQARADKLGREASRAYNIATRDFGESVDAYMASAQETSESNYAFRTRREQRGKRERKAASGNAILPTTDEGISALESEFELMVKRNDAERRRRNGELARAETNDDVILGEGLAY